MSKRKRLKPRPKGFAGLEKRTKRLIMSFLAVKHDLTASGYFATAAAMDKAQLSLAREIGRHVLKGNLKP